MQETKELERYGAVGTEETAPLLAPDVAHLCFRTNTSVATPLRVATS